MSSSATPDHFNYAANSSQYGVPPPVPPPKPPTGLSSTPGLKPPPPLPAAYDGQVSELSADRNVSPPSALGQVAVIEPTWLPRILVDKSTADLHEILADHSLQAALLNDPNTSHAAIQQSSASLRPLIEANIALATSLEATAERLTAQRAVTQSRLLALRALEQQHRTKISETETALQEFSPMALYQRLSAGATEQEQLLRGIEESWIDEAGQANERELGDWIKRVKDASRTAFLHKERKARWDEGRVGGWK